MVDEKYQYIKQIGYGAYGVVCSALDKKANKKVAIKKVSTDRFTVTNCWQVPNAFEDLIDAKRIVREIKLLRNTFFPLSCDWTYL